MKNMTLEKLAEVCGGTLVCRDEDRMLVADGAQVDSRSIGQGDLFFASKGNRDDAHKYIGRAFESGAVCAVCEEKPETDRPYILVKNSYDALRAIAKYRRSLLSIPIAGITGSVGKTSTKEAIAGVLSARFKVQKTHGNFNNDIGVPLTLMSIKDEHEAAVVEMGISDFGEMHVLADMVAPDICVITNIGVSHLENLGSQEGILKAKTEMFDHRRGKGAIVLNGDDALLNTIEAVDVTHPVRFGYSDGCDIRIKNVRLHGLEGADFTLEKRDGKELACHTDQPGAHAVTNAACAACVGFALGMSEDEIVRGMTMQESLEGRSHIIRRSDITIIDDCYNASPVSMKEAIDLLCLAESRKVAIFGDMFELGKDKEEMHREVGAYFGESSADLLLTAGELTAGLNEAAVAAGKTCIHYESADELVAALPEQIRKGDAVLVKASHGMDFKRIVKALSEMSLS